VIQVHLEEFGSHCDYYAVASSRQTSMASAPAEVLASATAEVLHSPLSAGPVF
jgi:hypothetical protein